MKLELKENMYVRTNDGYINKIKKVNQFNVLVYGRDLFGEELNIPNNEITKASYNIIDILEVGDYVNGLKITSIDKTFEGNVLVGLGKNFGFSKFDNDYKITSVVTHEQMEQMTYKVGE